MERFKDEVSCVVCLHREGEICIPTFKALFSALHYARQKTNRYRYSLFVALDNTDQNTRTVLAGQLDEARSCFDSVCYEDVSYGCPARTRNHAIQSVQEGIVLIIDGDDIVDHAWIYGSADFLSSSTAGYILHPQYNLIFGETPVFMQHASMSKVSLYNLPIENYWTALCSAHRKTFIQFPYQSNISSTVYGYEDWNWNIATILGGCIHHTLSDSWHFVRRKKSGVSFEENRQSRVVRESELFMTKSFLYQDQRKDFLAIADIKDIDEDSYFEIHPDVKRGVVEGFFTSAGYHYLKYGRHERRVSLPKSFRESYTRLKGFDLDLDECISKISTLTHYSPVKYNEITKSYLACLRLVRTVLLCRIKTNPISHVLIAPWLKRGGADLACLYHLRYLSQKGASTVLILTEDAPSDWISKLPKDVFVLEFGKYLSCMPSPQDAKLLFLVIQLLSPNLIHCLNSRTGWECIQSYGSEITKKSKIYVSLYCNDYDSQGNPTGYSSYLPHSKAYISRILSDNSPYLESLIRRYKISPSQVNVLKHPILSARHIPDAYSEYTNTVLWASRMDRQKNPSLLYSIASQMPGVVFIVYGEPLLDKDLEIQTIINNLRKLSNVILMGGFDDFSQIVSSRKYSAFLYTSLWDGLPNIVLEAACAGLPIVSSSVGGLPDLLSPERGTVVQETSNPHSFTKAIDYYLMNPDLANKHRLALREHILESFTWEAYVSDLDSVQYSHGSSRRDLCVNSSDDANMRLLGLDSRYQWIS